VQGLPQGAKDVMRFTAPEGASYRIFCGVPGRGLSGMWIRFKVDPAAKAPSWVTGKKEELAGRPKPTGLPARFRSLRLHLRLNRLLGPRPRGPRPR
jgi:hypothetical protein